METIANSIPKMEGRSMQKRKSLLFLYVKQSDSKSCLFSQLNSTVSMTVRKYSILCIYTLTPADIFKYNNYKVVLHHFRKRNCTIKRSTDKRFISKIPLLQNDFIRYIYNGQFLHQYPGAKGGGGRYSNGRACFDFDILLLPEVRLVLDVGLVSVCSQGSSSYSFSGTILFPSLFPNPGGGTSWPSASLISAYVCSSETPLIF